MFLATESALVTGEVPLGGLCIDCGTPGDGVTGHGSVDLAGEVPSDGLHIDGRGVSLGHGA